MKAKKEIIIIIGIVILILLLVTIKNRFIPNERYIFSNIELKDNLHYITNREILFIDDNLFIGNNKKELENGYYDIKVQNIEGKLQLNINRLVKQYEKNMFLDEEYVTEIFNYLNSKFEYLLDKEKFLNSVISIYSNVRKDFEAYKGDVIMYLDNNINIKMYAKNYSVLVEVWR